MTTRSGITTTRRHLVWTAGAAVVSSPLIGVATADTDSGNVELETTATIPTNTSVEITVYEDTSGDGTADRQETNGISDGTTTTEFGLLQASTAQGHELWIEIDMSTTDGDVTPSLDSATLTLPETAGTTTTTDGDTTTQEPAEPVSDDPQSIGEIWQNYRAFVAMVVIFFAGVGLWSKSLTLAAWAGYLAFLTIAFRTGTPLFENIAYATLVLVFLGMAFKVVRLEFEGES